MIRTWLFVPADGEAKVLKAFAGTADAIILDLEDGIGPSAERKAVGRDVISRLLEVNPEQRQRCYVRINELSHDDVVIDIQVAIRTQAAGVILPKCEGPQDIQALAKLLEKLEADIDVVRPEKTAIIAIVTETARGVQLLPEFRSPLPRLQALMWGAEDLCADLGGTSNRAPDCQYLSPYIAARDGCLFAARALGVSAVDAVYTAFRDTAGLEAECKNHSILGFDAKAAIHPSQLPVIDQAFRPSAEQIEWAKKVVSSFEKSVGAAALDGSMIDAPHLKRARNIVQRSRKAV